MSLFQQLIDAQTLPPELQRDRLESIRSIEQRTGRPLIVYAADWLTPVKQSLQGFPRHVMLDHNDVLPFQELVGPITGPAVDVLIHSPGGIAEAAERVVKLLRGKFSQIRFFVPHTAMSAATMLCLSGNEIAMGETSALGPIDPQLNGVPVRAIKKGFERVQKLVGKTPGGLAPYLPLLQKYDLHTFEICENAEKLAKQLVREWLRQYMFAGDRSASSKAHRITAFFASHDRHLSHNRTVGVDECKSRGLKIHDLRGDADLAKLVWDLWQRIEYFFGLSPVAKLFESSSGVSFMRAVPGPATVQIGPFPVMPAPPQR